MKTKALISCAVTRFLVMRLKKRLLTFTLIRAFVLLCSIVKLLFFQDLASVCGCIGWVVSDLV